MNWPQELLSGVAWACRRERYPDRAKFAAAVQDYNDKIMEGRSTWSPASVVLNAPRVEVQFMCWTQDGEDQPEFVVEIEADDGRTFTQLELFHKLCDGIGARLELEDCDLFDHQFFEGLAGGGEQAFYNVRFGS